MKDESTRGIYLDPSIYDPKSLTEALTSSSSCFQANPMWQSFRAHAKFLGLEYLPIEAFKYLAHKLHIHEKTAKTFYSSGTTLGDRSKVEFSNRGLELYEQQAWISFQAVLKQTLQASVPKGYSLIPLDDSWADSSLAHMLKSFQRKIPVAEFSHVQVADEPVWIFGTAFHFINLFDEHKRFRLPEGSIVFETGGTKGKSRELGRKELYDCICELFSISTEQIISEYGMSELSCQAYDFVPRDQSIKLDERRFKFPTWVETRVMDENGEFQTQGIGALCVYDPLRVDIGLTIRTQDLVNLSVNGDFQILGRIKQASLKGCSLRVDTLSENQLPKKQLKLFKRKTTHPNLVATNTKRAIEKLHEMLSDKQLEKLVLEFFSGKKLFAEWMLEDLRANYPKNSESLTKTIIDTRQHINYPEDFYLIGASTHPFAILPILLYANILDINLKLRPSLKGAKLESYFARALSKPGQETTLLDPNWKLDGSSQLDQPIILFGSDETIEHIKNISGTQLQGFGSQIRIGICYSSEIEILKDDILKEAFALEQKGCRCIRILIEIEDETESPLELEDYWDKKVDSIEFDDKLNLQHYYIASQLTEDKVDLNFKKHKGYFPKKTFDPKLPQVSRSLANSAFVLPIIKIKPDQLEKLDLNFITAIACSSKSIDIVKKLFTDQVEVEAYAVAHQKIWENHIDGKLIFHMTAAGAN